jgi:hypothetical protein
MKFTAALVALISSTALAAPADQAKEVKELSAGALSADVKDMWSPDDEPWIVRHLQRTCDKKDRFCEWEFWIDSGSEKPQYCCFEVNAKDGKKASQTDIYWVECEKYLVSTDWDEYLGYGFTQFSIYDTEKSTIIFPGYTDKELWGGKVVSPDKKYHPSLLH